MSSIKPTEYFDLFWQQSAYTPFNIKAFAAAQEQYAASDKPVSILEYPAKPQTLVLPKTTANYLARRRGSVRTFGSQTLSKRELGKLFSSFYAFNGLEHRAYPSAGGSYAMEVFCITNKVAGLNGKILYYNPDIHAVSVLGKAPTWQELSPNVNLVATGVPQCLFIFVLFPQRLTAKYVERGGRFGLIEAGAAMQQLALQLAGSRSLKGVAIGGLIDEYWLTLLGLNKSGAMVVLGYACGK